MKIEATPIEQLYLAEVQHAQVSLSVKREDLNHPSVSGNKARKLILNLEKAKAAGYKTILTFGGAFSNHIYATAAAGKLEGFKTIGIIRGEEQLPLNPTLSFVKDQGMQIHYMDRSTYRKKQDMEVINKLRSTYGDFYLIPEGGTNDLAIKGCQEIIDDFALGFTHYCLSVGTGGTITGIIQKLAGQHHIIGYSALKGDFLTEEINSHIKNFELEPFQNWEVNNDYHFGGYAKSNSLLIDFILEIEKKYNFPLDPVYTGKAFFGLIDMIKKGMFPKGSRILFIHTGGLQGRAGFGL